MSIRLLAKELYRLHQQVEALEKELLAAPGGRREDLREALRKARAERDRIKDALDGQKDSRR